MSSNQSFTSFTDRVKDREISLMAISPDGESVALVSDANEIYIRRVRTRQEQLLGKIENNITSVAFHSDGNCLATGCEDSVVRLWSVSGNRQLFSMSHHGPIRVMAFSESGLYLAAADKDFVAVWRSQKERDRGANRRRID
jgi:WD40 repeat protein